MPKSKDADDEKPKKLSSYTLKLDGAQMDKLGQILSGRGWEKFDVAYARFAYKGNNVNVTAYESGKLVVAGKGTEEFVTMTLESEITLTPKLGYDEVNHPDWFEAHAGLDESGKGDFFGPVVAATVIAQPTMIRNWMDAGIRDSKKIADPQIVKFDELIRATHGAVVVTRFCRMPRYNELMARPRANLNTLLAWLHGDALTEALKVKQVPWGLLDQFTEKPLVQRELERKNVKNFTLKMRTKAEEDPVVAAASVVARAEFVRAMHALSVEFGAKLQKGAGPLVKEQAHQIIEKFGVQALPRFCKLHFRTAYEVVKDAGKLGEFPLPEPKERFERD